MSVHKNYLARERIETRGCCLVFLPAYGPTFSSIENASSKLKGFLRKAKARTQEALKSIIAAGLAILTNTDARLVRSRLLCYRSIP